MLDDYLAEIDRDPATLTRSLLAFDEAFDAWSDPGAVPELVDRYAPLGFTEFIFYPPEPRDWRKFLKVGVDVLGSLRPDSVAWNALRNESRHPGRVIRFRHRQQRPTSYGARFA